MLLLFHPSSQFYDWKCAVVVVAVAVAVAVVVWAQKNNERIVEDWKFSSNEQTSIFIRITKSKNVLRN